MASCINTNTPEFRSLQEASGLSEFLLKSYISEYQEKYGEEFWPALDELPNANSELFIKDYFELSSLDATSAKEVMLKTNTTTIEGANAQINSRFTDLEICLTKIADKVVFNFTKRPSPFEFRITETAKIAEINSAVYIGTQLEKLAKLYGILVNQVTNSELKESGLLAQVPEYSEVSAFVHEGQIYLNQDVADVDAPTHEMLHILMGGLKYTNPDMYYSLVEQVKELDNFDNYVLLMPNRALPDICEEVFVKEYAKHLTGVKSMFDKLNPGITHQINHQMSRVLDSILMGDNSVRILPEATLALSSLSELGKLVNAHNMESDGFCFVDASVLNRVMANTKHELMKSGDLKEECS